MSFFENGWQVFEPEEAILNWVGQARPAAQAAVANPSFAQWHQCDGTWFVGLDALPNDAQGQIGAGPALRGAAVDFATAHCGGWPDLHRGQVSVVYPGYPRARDGEDAAALRYRIKRDAAHVDGVLGLGTPKRRFVKEPHAFVLGIPLTEANDRAAPMTIWEGSHKIMQAALGPVLQGEDLDQVDITQTYVAARKHCFETCPRRIVHVPVGACYLVHRLALHGVAPWQEGASADPEGRMIAYFRPQIAGGVKAWIGDS